MSALPDNLPASSLWPPFSLCANVAELPDAAGDRIWQRKEDGVRAYVSHDGLMMRGGRYQQHRLSIGVAPGWLLDGEVIVPGGSVGDVTSAIARKRWQDLRYVVFDVLYAANGNVAQLPYRLRWGIVCDFFPKHAVEVHCLPDHPMPPVPDEWEGIIGKRFDATWTEGRSNDCVKWKRTAYLEAVIMGFEEGTGHWRGQVGKVAFGLRKPDGQLLQVGVAGGLSQAERELFARDPARYIGRTCLIKHYGMNRLKLRNPVFERLM